MKNKNFNLTLSMLAKMCGVSSGTVDRALHDRDGIKKETKEKILETARKHGYIDDSTKGNNLIGIVVFEVNNRYFSELLMSLENECRANGYSLVVMFTKKDCDTEYNCIKQLYYMGVKGIVLCPINEGEAFCQFLRSIKTPVVTVGNRLEGFPYIGTDDKKAMYDAADALSSKYSRIIYYSPALNSKGNKSAQEARFAGFLNCASDKKLNYELAKTPEELEKLLNSDTDWAILCSTDHYMMQVKLKYPERAVMGFDGIEELKKFGERQMSVETDINAVARESLKVITEGKSGNIIIPHSVIAE